MLLQNCPSLCCNRWYCFRLNSLSLLSRPSTQTRAFFRKPVFIPTCLAPHQGLRKHWLLKNDKAFNFSSRPLTIKYALKEAENREVWEKENHVTIFFRSLGNNGRLFSCSGVWTPYWGNESFSLVEAVLSIQVDAFTEGP